MAWANVSECKRFSPEKFQKINLFETDRMFCDVYCFEAGQEQAPHQHQGADKIYYVLEGKGLVQIGAERLELEGRACGEELRAGSFGHTSLYGTSSLTVRRCH